LYEISTSIQAQILDGKLKTKSFIQRTYEGDYAIEGGGVNPYLSFGELLWELRELSKIPHKCSYTT
jgi:hypothetical protein